MTMGHFLLLIWWGHCYTWVRGSVVYRNSSWANQRKQGSKQCSYMIPAPVPAFNSCPDSLQWWTLRWIWTLFFPNWLWFVFGNRKQTKTIQFFRNNWEKWYQQSITQKTDVPPWIQHNVNVSLWTLGNLRCVCHKIYPKNQSYPEQFTK